MSYQFKVKIFENEFDEIEQFRLKTFEEGNQSLAYNKFDPANFAGKIWLCYIDSVLASISAVEHSHYTGDPETAVRVCRYHILKRFRHTHCGFRMLKEQINWFDTSPFKVMYWTHDIKNKALNEMYQHKRRMLDPEAKEWFESDWYKRVQMEQRYLFEVDPNSDLLQYIYYISKPNFQWNPLTNVVPNNLMM